VLEITLDKWSEIEHCSITRKYSLSLFHSHQGCHLELSSMNDCNTTTSVIYIRSCNTSQQSSSIRFNIISTKAHSVAGNSVNPSSIVLQFTRTPIVKQLKGMCDLHNCIIHSIYLLWRKILTTPLS
jgi:hypothetical protein